MAVGAVVARILTQYSDKGSKAAQKDIKKSDQLKLSFSETSLEVLQSKKITKIFK